MYALLFICRIITSILAVVKYLQIRSGLDRLEAGSSVRSGLEAGSSVRSGLEAGSSASGTHNPHRGRWWGVVRERRRRRVR